MPCASAPEPLRHAETTPSFGKHTFGASQRTAGPNELSAEDREAHCYDWQARTGKNK
jgi:hypothetical protein